MLKLIDYTSFFKNWSQSKVFKNQTTSIQESLWASSVHIFTVLEHMLFGVPNKVTLVKLFHTSNRYWRIISHMMYIKHSSLCSIILSPYNHNSKKYFISHQATLPGWVQAESAGDSPSPALCHQHTAPKLRSAAAWEAPFLLLTDDKATQTLNQSHN